MQYYLLKVTENKDEMVNEFDLREKGEEVPDSDDEGDASASAGKPKVGDKRPAAAAPTGGLKGNKLQKK